MILSTGLKNEKPPLELKVLLSNVNISRLPARLLKRI